MLKSINNIIVIASGKGGVGKSTVTANLAATISAQGLKVGILDADIYGPSQGALFGINEGTRPEIAHQKYLVPITVHNISLMSIAFLLDENTPVIWRAPMANSALMQMMTQTLWGELDYLFIDMPPGTGDIALTIAQKVPQAQAIITTTPQKLSTLDAQKTLEMFVKVKIPILGVIENMATHMCPNCSHISPIFANNGGLELAQKYDVPLLGSLPIAEEFGIDAENGIPSVLSHPEHQGSKIYTTISQQIMQQTNNNNKKTSNISLLNL